jgi:hypothetical protein
MNTISMPLALSAFVYDSASIGVKRLRARARARVSHNSTRRDAARRGAGRAKRRAHRHGGHQCAEKSSSGARRGRGWRRARRERRRGWRRPPHKALESPPPTRQRTRRRGDEIAARLTKRDSLLAEDSAPVDLVARRVQQRVAHQRSDRVAVVTGRHRLRGWVVNGAARIAPM